MSIKYSNKFKRNFKLRIYPKKSLLHKFNERVRLFEKNPDSPILKDHKLSGNKLGLRSFSITGDVRILYSLENDTAYFVDIGTHNQVY